jgi:hypothetical protein
MAEPLRYPLKAFTDKTDYLQIGVVNYTAIGKNENYVSERGTRRNTRNIKELEEIILLPIPSNIQDNNSTNYGSSELNSIAGAALGGIMRTMEAGKKGETVKQKLGRIKDTALGSISEIYATAGGTEEIANFATRQLASSAVGILGVNITPNQILARSEGTILNPNMELLFNGPTLRNFRFSFKMTPRNRPEGEQIKKIIRCFKKNMAPKVGENSTFLKTPNVFELTYRQGSNDHKFLNKFKQCFLSDISVNYTGEGTYATYHDGTPVSMIMDLTFKEIQPIYSSDYEDESSGTGVGY